MTLIILILNNCFWLQDKWADIDNQKKKFDKIKKKEKEKTIKKTINDVPM